MVAEKTAKNFRGPLFLLHPVVIVLVMVVKIVCYRGKDKEERNQKGNFLNSHVHSKYVYFAFLDN